MMNRLLILGLLGLFNCAFADNKLIVQSFRTNNCLTFGQTLGLTNCSFEQNSTPEQQEPELISIHEVDPEDYDDSEAAASALNKHKFYKIKYNHSCVQFDFASRAVLGKCATKSARFSIHLVPIGHHEEDGKVHPHDYGFSISKDGLCLGYHHNKSSEILGNPCGFRNRSQAGVIHQLWHFCDVFGKCNLAPNFLRIHLRSSGVSLVMNITPVLMLMPIFAKSLFF